MRIGQVSQSFDISQFQPRVSEAGASREIQPADASSYQAGADMEYIQSQMAPDVQMDQELLDESLKQANKSLAAFDRVISREVHEVTGSVMYKIVDINTHKVIAEFPPKKIQDMIAKMWELAGLFVDEKA